MESITKTKLSFEQIQAITRQAFGAETVVQAVTELTDGYFNTAYKLERLGETAVILKVAPPKNVQVLRYEQDLMSVEVLALQQANSIADIPAPQVMYRKQGESVVENDFFFMEFVPGTPLDKCRHQLSEEQAAWVAQEIGRIAKQLNSIKGSVYGHPTQPEKQFINWADAFLFMIQELLEDAADAKVALPYDYKAIYKIVEAHRGLLSEVDGACLVHKDLWAGNIFVNTETNRVTGVVDFERAIYADALMEPVCGFLLENDDFLQAYLGRTELTQSEKIRTTLYKIYLFLLMVIECPYRQYGDNGQEKWAREQLENSFEQLTKYSNKSF